MAVKYMTFDSREEWLKGRTSRIGGSDASCILGLNPYKTNAQLFDEKTGRTVPEDISEKPYVKYGSEAEMHLRELFRLDFPEYELLYAENNMWTNDKYPFAHASLDGWLVDRDGRKGIWECKTTNIRQSSQREKWNHRIPDNYYVQCLWYLAITEFDFCILKAQLKSEFEGDIYIQTKHYRFERDEVQADIDYLMKKGSDFWECVKANKRPPLVLPGI